MGSNNLAGRRTTSSVRSAAEGRVGRRAKLGGLIQLFPILAHPIMANASQHLTYPSSSSTPPPTLPASEPIVSTPKHEVLSDRLYVGNLHPTVDEYAQALCCANPAYSSITFLRFPFNANRSGLLKIFSKCGKVSRLDYLFHKSGPAKGKPRGYAFVEFSDPKVCPSFRPHLAMYIPEHSMY